MFRNSRILLTKWTYSLNQTYSKPVYSNLKRCRDVTSVKKRWQSTRNYSQPKFSSSIRNAGKLALVLIGTSVGVKIWLVTSDCQAAKTLEFAEINDRKWKTTQSLEEAIDKSRDLLQRIKDELGCPGVVIAVSVDGQMVWSQGLGYSDVENRVPCTPATVMRIASISKPITTTVAGKLMEQGLLDIDRPVQEYVPHFPDKTVDGEKVTMTTRQVMAHLSGLRSYNKEYMKKGNESKSVPDKEGKKESDAAKNPVPADYEQSEFYIKRHFSSVKDSLGLFKDDPLVHKPGTKFLYTSHGYTLLSAVLEGAAGKPITELFLGLFKDLGLHCTYLDENTPVIYNRSRYYVKTSKGRLINAPYVDTSYKWAGGGLMSNVSDLVKYGNIMLYSYQFAAREATLNEADNSCTESGLKSDSQSDTKKSSNEKVPKILSENPKKMVNQSKLEKEKDNLSIKESSQSKADVSLTPLNSNSVGLSGYLKPETVRELWEICEHTDACIDMEASYSLGWSILPASHVHGCCRDQKQVIYHTGGAVGASSVLLVIPQPTHSSQREDNSSSKGDNPPRGIVIAILTNLISVGLRKTGLQIAEEFSKVECSKKIS